jgi:N-acetylmuramoyl-L-alanine amidase
MRRLIVLSVAGAAVVAAVLYATGGLAPDASRGVAVPAGAPLPLAAEPDPDEPPELDPAAPPMALAPPGGAIVQPGVVRLPRPKIDLNGPRRIGIQAGHWQTDDVPKEYGTRILTQTGASWGGYNEVDVNLDIAERVAKLLRAQGVVVDVLPTTVPVGYLADAFIALHADSDGVGELSGFKMAHSSRRGPFEDALMRTVKDTYAAETGLDYDAEHVTRNMLGYFAMNWSRYQHATSPFTPSTILEMGFLSNDGDLTLMVDHADRVAIAIANGLLKFLDENPRSKIFGQDLLIPQAPIRQGQAPSPTTPP